MQAPEGAPEVTRFETVRVYVDSGEETLAAYEFELRGVGGRARVVGLENGEHPAFDAPHYDPNALRGGRIIVAALNVGGELPHGRIRVATVHFEVHGDVAYEGELIAAVTESGERIRARVEFLRGE